MKRAACVLFSRAFHTTPLTGTTLPTFPLDSVRTQFQVTRGFPAIGTTPLMTAWNRWTRNAARLIRHHRHHVVSREPQHDCVYLFRPWRWAASRADHWRGDGAVIASGAVPEAGSSERNIKVTRGRFCSPLRAGKYLGRGAREDRQRPSAERRRHRRPRSGGGLHLICGRDDDVI